MHDALYRQRGQLGLPDVLGAARGIGLDTERIAAELESGAHAAAVQRDLDGGLATGVRGTPTFFVNGERHEGAFDAQSLIAALEGR